jgi:hypothetical protein
MAYFKRIRKTSEGRRFRKEVYDWLARAGVVKKPGEPGARRDIGIITII